MIQGVQEGRGGVEARQEGGGTTHRLLETEGAGARHAAARAGRAAPRRGLRTTGAGASPGQRTRAGGSAGASPGDT